MILINSNSLQLAAIVRYVVEQVALDPEVRRGLLSECDGLSNLVDWLDSINRRPGLSELDSKLSSTEVNIPALKQCIGYAEDGYQRNVIKKTEHYELVAICWTPGQLTPIHDHVGTVNRFMISHTLGNERLGCLKQGHQ